MRSVPYIASMEMAECGATSLAMVLAFHGRHVPLSVVREQCGVSRDGTSAYAIARVAQRHGLSVQALRLEPSHLWDTRLPAILHWEFNHFVVLERVTRSGAVIVDPNDGRRLVSHEELGRSFTGVTLTFQPGPDFRRLRRTRPSLGRYKHLIRRSLPALGIILGASSLLDAVGLIFPAANQILIDFVVGPRQTRWLWALAATLAGATITRTLLLVLRGWIVLSLQFVLDMSLMAWFVDHLMHLPISFFQTRTPGDLVRRVEDNTTLRDIVTNRAVTALLDSVLLVGYGAMMLAYDFRLGAVVVALAALRLALLVGVRDKIRHVATTELAAMGREGGALLEALSAPEATKAFGIEALMVAKVVDQMVPRINAGIARRRIASGVGYLTAFMDGASKAVIVWFGGRQVLMENMTIGVLSSFLMLQMLFSSPIESLIQVLGDLEFMGRQLRRLDDVLETAIEASGTEDPGRLRGAIRLEHVSYRYAADGPFVVKDINVEICPGEKVAFVGRSGAGKSTLAKLILGMYPPSEGSVRVDGRDLRTLDLSKVREQFGVVLQEPFLFDDTVRANLSADDEHLSIEPLRHAAQIACVDQIIEGMPGGYDARVGASGSRLSGGQRQLLAIARAIARQPAIVLLDEATSSLDLTTEQRVHANLRYVASTRIVIAHRLATVMDADRIFVLEGGRIVDQGRYAELAARPGIFQELVRAYAA
jgi:ATP-binding cassette, subfamily B, bacterial